MTRQEYLQALAPAANAWRAALRRSTMITVPVNVGFVVWVFHLLDARDPDFDTKVSLGFLFATAVQIATLIYMGDAFSRNSPACHNCGKNVRLLQRRRVLTSGKCDYCHAELFEA